MVSPDSDKRDDLSFDRAGPQIDLAHRRNLSSRATYSTRIEDQCPIMPGLVRPMAVTEDDQVGLGIDLGQTIGNALIEHILAWPEQVLYKPIACLRPETGPAAVVDHNAVPSDGELPFDGQVTATVAEIFEVWIATHSVKWCQTGQAVQVFDAIHVTRVQNEIHILKCLMDLVRQTVHAIGQVGVGEDTDCDGIRLGYHNPAIIALGCRRVKHWGKAKLSI